MSATVDGVIEKFQLYMPESQVSREDMVAFCFEAIRYIGLTRYLEFKVERLPLVSGEITLPINAMRAQSVNQDCAGCQPIQSAYQSGRKIRFKGTPPSVDELIVRYTHVPVDERGEPDIGDGLEDVCMWWAVKAKMVQPFLNGSVPGDRYGYVQQELNQALRSARGSFREVSNNELDNLVGLIHQPFMQYIAPQ